MEKLIYLLWKDEAESRGDFSRRLLSELPHSLPPAYAHGLQLNVVDEAIRPAEHMLIENEKPRFYAMVSLWLDTALARQPAEAAMARHARRIAGYLVTESCPLRDHDRVVEAGQRSYGFSQVVLLRRPPRLTYREWLDIWQGSHTSVAIESQSTYCYRQNVIARALTADAPDIQAIVEECFPPAAMTSWQSFYGAEGDDALFMRNSRNMVQSCRRFIDFDKIEACATSEYHFQTIMPGAAR